MHVIGWLLAAAMATPAPARAGGATPARLRTYMAEYSVRNMGKAHALIPAWARRYNVNCDACHYPVPPRLNATGIKFKWAGYRMPDQIGDKVEVEKIQNYLAGHGVLQYEYTKTEGQAATNAFAVPEVGLFYGGPVGRSYSGFLELERNPDGTTDPDLPSSLAFPGDENKRVGYWVSGQYYIPKAPLVLFGRFESVDPNTQVSNDAVRHFVAGAVLPINLPQYLRWTLEYRLDSPQGGLPKTRDVVTQLQLNF